MKVGIFGSEYQIERQNLIKRLFEKLREQEADIYVDSPFYTFLTDAFGFEPVVSGLLVGDEFDLDIALSVGGDGTFLRTAARVNKQDIPILGINTGRWVSLRMSAVMRLRIRWMRFLRITIR